MRRRQTHDGRTLATIRRGLVAVAATSVVAVVLSVGPLASVGVAGAVTYDPGSDVYSMRSLAGFAGAAAFWDAGYTGRGIDVAVIDTGVSPVPGLDGADKLIHGPDLSFDSQSPNLAHLDGNGHGTFMAGIIAGHDAALTAPYSTAPASAYRGIAPDARIVSVKVGSAEGAVDVSQVIAGIDWVVQHKNDNGLNIRIINLSYGTNSLQTYSVDPLSYAVERAWRAGIVVVAAAGNTGYQRGNKAPGLANPAYNPFVIGVGGYDPMGTSAVSNDVVGSYSASSAGCGARCKNPDFVAIGSHVQGLRVPNSYLDLTHPEGQLGPRYFRGSGTSQAAAMTSGAIALILQKYPGLTPDQVKRFITESAKKVPGADSQAHGAGELTLAEVAKKKPASYTQNFAASTGNGTLELARGTDHVAVDGVTLSGERDIMGVAFDAAAMATLEAQGRSWSGGTWNGRSWSSDAWSGRSWSTVLWSGNAWSGRSWSGRSWSTATWAGTGWSGRTWSSAGWASSTWSGHAWSGGSWS